MKKYKINVVWEAEIEMELDETDPEDDYYMARGWDEIYQAMLEAGIHEEVSFKEVEERG